jgi:ferritin-like metal-binding protein YciE
MIYSTLQVLFNHTIRDLVVAEKRIIREIPKLIEGASSSELKILLGAYAEERALDISNVERVLSAHNISLETAHAKSVDALIRQAHDIAEKRGDQFLLDIELISVVRRWEELQKAGYEFACLCAETLGYSDFTESVSNVILHINKLECSMLVLLEDILDSIHPEVLEISQKNVVDKGVSYEG